MASINIQDLNAVEADSLLTELNVYEQQNVQGGLLPLLVGAALLLGGCAHCKPYVKK